MAPFLSFSDRRYRSSDIPNKIYQLAKILSISTRGLSGSSLAAGFTAVPAEAPAAPVDASSAENAEFDSFVNAAAFDAL